MSVHWLHFSSPPPPVDSIPSLRHTLGRCFLVHICTGAYSEVISDGFVYQWKVSAERGQPAHRAGVVFLQPRPQACCMEGMARGAWHHIDAFVHNKILPALTASAPFQQSSVNYQALDWMNPNLHTLQQAPSPPRSFSESAFSTIVLKALTALFEAGGRCSGFAVSLSMPAWESAAMSPASSSAEAGTVSTWYAPLKLEIAAVLGIQLSPSLVCVSVIWVWATPAKSICEGRA